MSIPDLPAGELLRNLNGITVTSRGGITVADPRGTGGGLLHHFGSNFGQPAPGRPSLCPQLLEGLTRVEAFTPDQHTLGLFDHYARRAPS